MDLTKLKNSIKPIKNPKQNNLGKNIDLRELKDAINRVGFPLQLEISKKLEQFFGEIEEEWSFVDQDTMKTRNIDILANNELIKPNYKNPARIRPQLTLIVECKKSEYPYIFFISKQEMIPNYPMTSGEPHEYIEITEDGIESIGYDNTIGTLDLHT